MDTLHKIEEDILQFCTSHKCEYDEAENSSRHPHMVVPEDGKCSREKDPKLKLCVSNDKRYRLSFADLIINRKGLEENNYTLTKKMAEEVKLFLVESQYLRDFELNAASTEISIKLERANTMKKIIKETLAEPIRKNSSNVSKNATFIFVSNCLVANPDDVEGCFDYARLLAISTQFKNIFEVNGMQCHILIDHRGEPFYETVKELFPGSTSVDIVGNELSTFEEMFVGNARESRYRLVYDNAGEGSIALDFEKYLLENRLQKGKDGFDKNIKICKVVKADGKTSNCIKTAAKIEHMVNETIGDLESNISLIIVSPAQQSWEAQLACICWKMLSGHRNNINSMALCCSGGCSPKYSSSPKLEKVTFSDYLRQKSMEIRESYITRYGTEVEGGNWERIISDVVTACAKLELLSSPLRSVAHLNVNTDKSQVASSRDSLFILYNYSRLSTLVRKYEDEQKLGKYPAIPSIDEVDFSHLREEQEWRIFMKYIFAYHLLLKDMGQLVTDCTTFRISPPINKVTLFLSSMARDVSSYYHQTKVLLDPMPHLFPLMFARIYLIQALEKVMHNAFKLLGVNPPVQM